MALWAAAFNGEVPAIKATINNNADINWRNEDDDDIGHTPLMAAAKRGQLEAVRLLLIETNCDVMAIDSKGLSAKHFAETNKYTDVVTAIKNWEFKHSSNDDDVDSEVDQPLIDGDKMGATGGVGSWFSSWFGGKEPTQEL